MPSLLVTFCLDIWLIGGGVVGGIHINDIKLDGRITLTVQALAGTNSQIAIGDLDLASGEISTSEQTSEERQGCQWLVEWDLVARVVDTDKGVVSCLLDHTVGLSHVR